MEGKFLVISESNSTGAIRTESRPFSCKSSAETWMQTVRDDNKGKSWRRKRNYFVIQVIIQGE